MIHHYTFDYSNKAAMQADGWNFIARTAAGGPRDTEQSSGLTVTYDAGGLQIPCDVGALWDTNNTRNSIFHDIAGSWTSVRMRFDFAPTQNYEFCGLVLYSDDDNYLMLARYHNSQQRVAHIRESAGVAQTNELASMTATTNIHFQITRNSTSGDMQTLWSTDGTSWNTFGFVDGSLVQYANPKVGIVLGESPSVNPVAVIHEVWLEDEEANQPEPILFKLTQSGWQSHDTVQL